MAELCALLRDLAAEKETLPVSEVYDSLLNRSGYLEDLDRQGTIEAEGRK